jgi:hypothetical protein
MNRNRAFTRQEIDWDSVNRQKRIFVESIVSQIELSVLFGLPRFDLHIVYHTYDQSGRRRDVNDTINATFTLLASSLNHGHYTYKYKFARALRRRHPPDYVEGVEFLYDSGRFKEKLLDRVTRDIELLGDVVRVILKGVAYSVTRRGNIIEDEEPSIISFDHGPLAPTPSGSRTPQEFIPYHYTYHPPPIVKSQFGSTVQTGSRSLRSSNYTGPTHDKKLRDGILMLDVDNTASSHPPTMVYAKNDPTKLVAPLSSWKQLPGQVHPTTRKKLGHSDLRKVRVGKIVKKKK